LILTSWNRPVSISAFNPSSMLAWSRRPLASGLKYERIVSNSTRRFPSTEIDDRVWAAAGDDMSGTATIAATGAVATIRAASSVPRNTRIPTFMRNAPLSILMPTRSPRIRQIPIRAACSQFFRSGKRPFAVQFQFNSKTLPNSHARIAMIVDRIDTKSRT
jgi:hypothetical protein